MQNIKNDWLELRTDKIKSFTAAIVPKFPISLILEPTNSCNLKCVFCTNFLKTAKPTFLDIKLAKKIMQDAHACGAREVGFYLTGEPLLHPQLSEMIKDASEIGFTYIYITTNGVLASEKLIREFSINGLHSIKFSINSGEKTEYAKVHGYDKYDSVIENLNQSIMLRDTRLKYGGHLHKVSVSTVYIDSSNFEAITKFKEAYLGKLDGHSIIKAQNRIGELEPRTNKDCHMIFNRIHVTAHGYLSLCCVDFNHDLIYADLNKENIGEAWTNTCATNFRKRFLNAEISNTLCDKCLNASTGTVFPLG